MSANKKRLAAALWMSLGLTFGSLGAKAQDQRAPAPWTLEGDGYIIVSAVSKADNLQNGFIKDSMKGQFRLSFGVVMLVDYRRSPVGPYKELLYIPGTFAFDDGRSHPSISKIFVSSLSSVTNGRTNWGIPKELADFTVVPSSDNEETITVSQSSQVIARFTLSGQGPQFPMSTVIMPRFLRTLGQTLDGVTYIFTPSGQGWAQHARVLEADSDPEFFPPLAMGKVLMAVKIKNFKLEFPQPKILPSSPLSN